MTQTKRVYQRVAERQREARSKYGGHNLVQMATINWIHFFSVAFFDHFLHVASTGSQFDY